MPESPHNTNSKGPECPSVDVAVIGGSVAAIAAALELRAAGLTVIVITGRSYLGEDICDSLRLRLPDNLDLSDPLARRLYASSEESQALLRPMSVKLELDRVLREADIPVLLSSAVGELRHDAAGKLIGISLHNRSGRQSLGCRAILDGTMRGEIARLAALPLTKPDRSLTVIRRVLGGEDGRDGAKWADEGTVSFETKDGTEKAVLWANHRTTTLADGSWAAWMKLEQDTRLHAFRPGQKLSADGVFALSGERLHPDHPPESADGDGTDISPKAVSAHNGQLWFSGPVANVDRTTRDRILRHDSSIAWGRHLGRLIVEQLRGSPNEAGSDSMTCARAPEMVTLDVDVLVVGGGTAGAPAAIAAARAGAKTLVAEFLSGLGGVGTLGLIGRYWFGNRVGFTGEVDAGAASRTNRAYSEGSWDVEAKMQWYHEQVSAAGGMIWYKTLLCGALREENRVVGAILGTPQGRVTVRAKCIVDATGGADVAASAGADTVTIGSGHLAYQGTGLPPRNPGADYTNTDYDFIDDSDARDAGSAFTTAREKFHNAFDAGQLIDSRERRRVVGDYEVTPMDIRLARVFPDSIVKARSNFDTHGFTVHPLFMIVPPDHDPLEAYIPLRALLPKGLEGILVTGLGISAHRDAMPVIRMQADVQNQGYAAGYIAAITGDGAIRNMSIDTIQSHLVAKGILEPEIAGAADTFPLPEAEIRRALIECVADPEQVDRLFTLDEEKRMSLLREAHSSTENAAARNQYAFILGLLGDATGSAELAADIEATEWDGGWNYTGMGQFGASMSPLDAHIIALGRCRDEQHLPVLIHKAQSLPASAEFSHYRALAEAFESIGHPAAAPAIEALLKRPNLIGHHRADIAARLATASTDTVETRFRNEALIELHLATALYRIDSSNSMAREILENYTRDERGLFSKYARSVLGK